MLETQLLGHVMSVVVPTMSDQLALGGIDHKDREKIIQIKLLLITGVRVIETKGTRLEVGHSCWEQRKLASIRFEIEIEIASELGIRFEIKIASGQLVEIDKVIKGCKLEIEGHVFDIDLIPFGHGSFDVIIGKRSDEKARFLMGIKKQEEIVVVREFPEVFLYNLPGLLHI
ncbi:hypothetical protein Tco_0741126 [Tanacetum coccineum]